MQDKITCVIVDDEPKMVALLADSMTELFPDINITGQFTDWKTALQHLRTSEPDILFTDISMPGKTGLELLELIPTLKSEKIIVTAHTEFALDAFSFDVCDYLLKPVGDRALIKAVDRALGRIAVKKSRNEHNASAHAVTDKIGIPDVKGIHYVAVGDIMYCETVNRYTRVVTTRQEILSSYNIGEYTKHLTAGMFLQLHRSYIINVRYVKRYDMSGMVVMQDDKEIPIPKKNKEAFLKMFQQVGK